VLTFVKGTNCKKKRQNRQTADFQGQVQEKYGQNTSANKLGKVSARSTTSKACAVLKIQELF
jgi:hypothetical protein